MKNNKRPLKTNAKETTFIFRLYVTGASSNSSRAITNTRKILENHLPGQFELEVIDVYQQPQIAKSVDLIALPLLVREQPLPERRLIGDMSDEKKVLSRLDLMYTNGNEERSF